MHHHQDLSLKHIVGFAVLFVALFAALFAGVVQVHSHNMMRHATAQNVPAAQQPANPN